MFPLQVFQIDVCAPVHPRDERAQNLDIAGAGLGVSPSECRMLRWVMSSFRVVLL